MCGGKLGGTEAPSPPAIVFAVLVVFRYLVLGVVPALVVVFVLATVVGTLGLRRQVRDRQRKKADR